MKHKIWMLPALGLLVASMGCSEPKREGHVEEANEEEESGNIVHFTEKMSCGTPFSVEPCRREPFGQVIRTMARIEPSESDGMDVVAKCEGIVVMGGRPITEGMSLAKGEILMTIESEGMSDGGTSVALTEAGSEYELAKKEYERKKDLADYGIISQGDMLRAKASYESASARYDNLRNNFPKGSQKVASPVKGYLTGLYVHNGSHVDTGQKLFSLSRNEKLYLKAEISPKYYPLMSHIYETTIRMIGTKNVIPMDSIGGRLLSYGRTTVEGCSLLPITFETDADESLLPGMFVELYIKTKGNEDVITVANDAIVEEMGAYFVFVRIEPDHYRKQQVVTGQTDGLRTEITSGLTGDESIVSEGAIMVKLAQTSGPLDVHSGHVH